jgi:Tfp pilus assembly PilM family ATPase
VARFLALDWDQNQLHVVAASVSGGRVTLQQAIVSQEEQSPNPSDAEALGQLLRDRLKAAKIRSAPVLACLGRDRLILKEVRYPTVPEAEEAGLVRFQAVKELTDSPDDVVLDYIPVTARSAPEQRALALIARRELVSTYQTLCQAAGLKLAALTPRAFGLAAAARKIIGTTALTPSPEPSDGAIAVAVLSGRWAEFCVLQGETLLLTRTLTISPHLAGEIRRNLALYAGQPGRPAVRALYLAGAVGGDLRERLADLTDLPLYSLDPLTGAEGLALPPAQRGGFTGAVGLLYARAAGALPINFVQARQPRPQTDPVKQRLILAAVAIVAIYAILSVASFGVLRPRYQQQLAIVESERTDVETQLAQVKSDAKRYKDLETWDSPVWLDEFYNLVARIPDTSVIRINEVHVDPIPRTAKSPYAARLLLKGTLQSAPGSRENPHTHYDNLIAQFNREGFYRYVAAASKTEGNQFTLTVEVKRRGPTDHKQVLTVTPKQAPENKTEPDKSGDSEGE